MMADKALRLVALLSLSAGIAVLLWALFIRPGQMKADAVRAAASATVANGEAAKARAARIITERTHDIERTIERQTIVNDRTIRAAPGAGDPVAPAVDRAGRAALCVRAAYRDDPACHQLLGADPAQLVDPDTGRAAAGG